MDSLTKIITSSGIQIKKYLLVFIGVVSLVFGFIGIFIPILPTTPFLLLSSFCFAKSSKKLHNWLINHKIFGKYIYNYITHHAIPYKAKISSIAILWITISISIYLVSKLLVTIILLIIATGVTIHLLKLKTLNNEEIRND